MADWYEKSETCAGSLRIKFVWWFCAVFGRRLARVLIFPICVFAYPFLRGARKSAKNFFKILNKFEAENGLEKTRPRPFRLVYNYSCSMLDKIAAASKKMPKNSLKFEDSPAARRFMELVNSGQGAVVIFSHIGNFEVLGACGAEEFKTRKPEIFSLVEDWSDSVFRKIFLEKLAESSAHFVDVSAINLATFETLSRQIGRGNLVAAAGDRLSKRSPEKYFSAKVLGESCRLPSGVFALAQMLGSPVFFANCVECGGGYSAYFYDASNCPASKKRGESLASEFAAFLEKSALKTPYQWFNFFDFFKD